MPDITQVNKKYFAAVLQSVAELHRMETEVEDAKNQIAQIEDFSTICTEKISNFRAIENEIIFFLANYSFEKGVDLSPVKDILHPLPALNQKLAEMSAEAKKLLNKPDRYNCHKAMEVCKKFVMFCKNEMKSTDYARVTAVLEKNIQNLLEIQNKFANEDADVFNLSDNIKKLSDHIKNYANRFNKTAVLNNAVQLIQSAEQAKFSDFTRIKQNLSQCIEAIKTIIKNFDNERKATLALINKLRQNSPGSWKDDNETLISEINDVIQKGTETITFSLQSFYDKEKYNNQKKKNDIDSFKQQHKSIVNRYDSQLRSNIIDKYVSVNELNSWLVKYKAIETERLKKLTKQSLIGIGIAAGVVILVLFWKQILMAIVGIIVVIIVITFLISRD